MLSDVFEMFYSIVRAQQYLHFILNFHLLKQKFLPVLIAHDGVTLKSEITNYYPEKEATIVLGTVLHSIIYNPKTYLYKINKKGIYEQTMGQKGFKEVKLKLEKKHYQDVEFLS